MNRALLAAVAAFVAVFPAPAVRGGLVAQAQPPEWTQDQPPLRIFGNTYYVGTRGLTAILITSDNGHVLIDGALPESADMIADHVRKLGFRIDDVELIVNSHVHFDHAGGIAALQRLSGARVAASPSSAAVLKSGQSGPDDPQYGVVSAIERVANVRVIADGEVLRVGSLAVQGHFTGGHTPGGTSWTWRSCDGSECLDIVYADSMTAVSAAAFKFSSSPTYRRAVADFEKSIAFLRKTRCDLLLTPHPDASGLWGRVAKRDAGDRNAIAERGHCARYADRAEAGLKTRLAREKEIR
jgi:metallo-beta-lactamase class B